MGLGGGGVSQRREVFKRVRWVSEVGRTQELCKSRGGNPGLPSLINLRFLWT